MTYAFYILINCNSMHENFVVNELKKIKSIKHIQNVFGLHNIIVRIETNNANEIDKIVSAQIQKIKWLTSTVVLTILKTENFTD